MTSTQFTLLVFAVINTMIIYIVCRGTRRDIWRLTKSASIHWGDERARRDAWAEREGVYCNRIDALLRDIETQIAANKIIQAEVEGYKGNYDRMKAQCKTLKREHDEAASDLQAARCTIGEQQKRLAMFRNLLAEKPVPQQAMDLTNTCWYWAGQIQSMLVAVGVTWGHAQDMKKKVEDSPDAAHVMMASVSAGTYLDAAVQGAAMMEDRVSALEGPWNHTLEYYQGRDEQIPPALENTIAGLRSQAKELNDRMASDGEEVTPA